MDYTDSERPTIPKQLSLTNNNHPLFDKDTVEYIHKEITRLEINNLNLYHGETDFTKGKNMAYRECARILTTILNNKLLKFV
jgi:hypothetical protein